jgi:hypothetical protein
MRVFPDNHSEIRENEIKAKKQILNEASSSRIICPECDGNGYIKIPHAVYSDVLLSNSSSRQLSVQQCEQCSSQGEIDGKV